MGGICAMCWRATARVERKPLQMSRSLGAVQSHRRCDNHVSMCASHLKYAVPEIAFLFLDLHVAIYTL